MAMNNHGDKTPAEPPMNRWIGRVAMVTGVASSTGQAVAETLVRQGMSVLGVDDGPDFDKLESDNLPESLKNENVVGELSLFRCDIKKTQSVKELFASIKSDPDLEGVDVCVHCAAAAFGESILSGNPDVWMQMMQTNVLAAAFITQATFKSLKERELDDGHIIFMNGMCSHRLVPGNKALHFFTATKFAARAMLEGIRYELRMSGSNTRVSAISAGVIETDVLQKLFNNDKDQSDTFLAEKKYLDVQDIADTIVYLLGLPPHVEVHDILVRSTDQIP